MGNPEEQYPSSDNCKNLSNLSESDLIHWIEDETSRHESIDVFSLVRVMAEFIRREYVHDFESACTYLLKMSCTVDFYNKLQRYFADEAFSRGVEKELDYYISGQIYTRKKHTLPEKNFIVTPTIAELNTLAEISREEKIEIRRLTRLVGEAITDEEKKIAQHNLDFFLDRLSPPTLEKDPHDDKKQYNLAI